MSEIVDIHIYKSIVFIISRGRILSDKCDQVKAKVSNPEHRGSSNFHVCVRVLV